LREFTDRYIVVKSILFSLFAASLMVLTTFKINENDIRVGSSDLFIPIFILLVSLSYYKNNITQPLLDEKLWIYLFLFSIWMLISLINGYFYTGHLIYWALFNKFFGWFLLLGYFLAGVYIGIQNRIYKIIFFRILFVVTLVICIYELLIMWMVLNGYDITNFKPWDRLKGFFENPNAFGIVLMTLFLLQIFGITPKNKLKNAFIIFSSIVILLTIFYTYSRSAWLGLFAGICTAVILEKKMIKYIFIIFILGFSLNYLLYTIKYNNPDRTEYSNKLYDQNYSRSDSNYLRAGYQTININVNENYHPDNITQIKKYKVITNSNWSNTLKYSIERMYTINERIDITKRAIRYWLNKPIFGIGLGGFIWQSKNEKVNTGSVTIHSSILWLLTETGIIGLILFSLIIINIFKTLLIHNTNNKFITNYAMISIIIAMIGASLGTEVIYQRYLWVLLGIFLVDENRFYAQ